jgi:excisionase family DNA binding protein
MTGPSNPGARGGYAQGHLGPPYHDDALLTLAQAADVLNVSYSTVTKWTARGEFCPAAFKLPSGRYRVRYRDLLRWALSLRSSA